MKADTTSLPGIIIPDSFKPPGWVNENMNKFKEEVKKSYTNTLNTKEVRNLIKIYILNNKANPAFPLDKKNVNKLLQEMYKVFSDEEFQWRYYLLYQAGFFLSTLTADSFTPESLELPEQFKPRRQEIIKIYHQKKEEARTEKQREEAIIWVDNAFKKLANEVLNYFREHEERYPIVNSIDSKAKGSPDDLRKLLIAIGLSINSKGEINDVIDRSGAEGLTPTQFFNYTSQALVSQYKKSKDTAIPGYLIRQLNSISASVKLSKEIDCGTKRYLSIKILNKDMLYALKGKMRKTSLGLEKIKENNTELIGQTVQIRSPLYCTAQDGICKTCYNPDFVDKMNLTENSGIGLLASTAQAGMLTNMTLKAAHTGLSLNKQEVDLTQDIYEYSE